MSIIYINSTYNIKNVNKKFFSPKKEKSILFRGKYKLFKSETENIDCYFEYGVGQSTLWILENTNAKIVAVDSDKRWIKKIKNLLSKKNFQGLNSYTVT